ncbi:MAG: hypothetical protein COB03_00235 [Alteromonas sp.]|nr:MAG: hypothetical protein COB03_00235 [Alteromonas sp.]
MNNSQKELNRRVNILVVVAFVVFMLAAKLLMPFEEELKVYGAFGVVLIVLVLSLISYLIESLITRLIKVYRKKSG